MLVKPQVRSSGCMPLRNRGAVAACRSAGAEQWQLAKTLLMCSAEAACCTHSGVLLDAHEICAGKV